MDVFYFHSPAEPAPHKDVRELKWSGKPSTKRRKVCSGMDASTYRAHVVRVAEPTVAANGLSSLPPHHLDFLLGAGYFQSSLSLLPNTANQYTSVVTPIPKAEDTFSHDEPPPVSGVSAPLESRIPSRISQPYHPRPESTDLWEEEDGRRIRFALPNKNDDHVERLRNSYHPSNEPRQLDSASHSNGQRPNQNEERPPPPGMLFRNFEAASLTFTAHMSLESFSQRFSLPLPPPAPLPSQSTSQVSWDDNFLAVDDHRRNYDFANFMDQWRSWRNNDVPAFRPEAGPSIWRKPQRTHVRHTASIDPDRDGNDVQGLSWAPFGVERRSALKARRLLHPQGLSTTTGSNIDSDGNDGLHYEARAFAPNHRARFSHYQLRNMMTAGSGRDVYYAAGSKIRKASLACPSATRTVMDLAKPTHSASPFKITCLATSASGSGQDGDILIAGGFNGEYAVLDLDSTVDSRPAEGVVSHAKDGIVNHTSTFRDRRNGTPYAAFCSNDHKLRVMDISQQRFIHNFEYDSAVNCSVVSADGRLRAVVHDGSDSWVTNAETGEILVKLEAHTDFAFACDWSSCGRYVATGAEDGKVIVWDARNWSRPLKALDCVMSCARSLHFANDGALVIAEGEDVVSVVDTDTFGLRQDIRFFGSIAGVSLLNGGAELVVANADHTVGGLMSFSRVAKGRGTGEYGRQVGSESRSRRRRDYEMSVVEEVFV